MFKLKINYRTKTAALLVFLVLLSAAVLSVSFMTVDNAYAEVADFYYPVFDYYHTVQDNEFVAEAVYAESFDWDENSSLDRIFILSDPFTTYSEFCNDWDFDNWYLMRYGEKFNFIKNTSTSILDSTNRLLTVYGEFVSLDDSNKKFTVFFQYSWNEDYSYSSHMFWIIDSQHITSSPNLGSIYKIVDVEEAVYKLPETPVNTGYSFDGWYRNSNFTIAYNGNPLSLSSYTKLYPKWVLSNFVANYYLNGEFYRADGIVSGSKATSYIPDCGDKKLIGWYSDPDFTQAFNFETSITSDINIYGRVEYVPEKKLFSLSRSSDYSFGSFYNKAFKFYTLDYLNSVITFDNGDEHVDFTFEERSSGLFYTSTINAFNLEYPVNLYAKVIEKNYFYEVYFIFEYDQWIGNNAGTVIGSFLSTDYYSVSNELNEFYVLPEVDLEESEIVYDWYYDSEYNDQYKSNDFLSENQILYPLVEAKNFTVRFYDDLSVLKRINYNYGQTAAEFVYHKDGYTFLGWYSDKDFINSYVFETPLTSDVNIYGKFEINTYDVKFFVNGELFKSITVPYNFDLYNSDYLSEFNMDNFLLNYGQIKIKNSCSFNVVLSEAYLNDEQLSNVDDQISTSEEEVSLFKKYWWAFLGGGIFLILIIIVIIFSWKKK